MKRAFLFGFTIAVFLFSSACGYQARTGTYAWIDVPVNDLVLADIQPVRIEGHAAAPGGVSQVDVFVDGALLTSIISPPGGDELVSFSAIWADSSPGTHIIQAVAYGAEGTTSEPDTVSITFGAAQAEVSVTPQVSLTPSFTPEISLTPTLTFTPTATSTRTLTPTPETIIEFWADPAEIQAGKCTTLRWNTANVSKVVFGGLEQPFSGSDSECPCVSTTYTLEVTLLNGTIVKRTASVKVNGTCATEVPPDTTPPPVPTPQVPTNGLTITCKASQLLVWLPVSDPSGIQEYQVVVQRSADNATWNALAFSPITGLTDKTTTIPVECGWYYRWRVRAIDGAGNISDWSGWWTFYIDWG